MSNAVRYNALSRVIESSLQKDSIPNRIIGGHKFFERMEIKDILAYLQLAENPGFTVSAGIEKRCWHNRSSIR